MLGVKLSTAKVIILFVTFFMCSTVTQANEVRSKAINMASDHFFYSVAMKLLRGSDTKQTLNNSGRKDWRYLGQGQQGTVSQSAYLSLSPQFTMITVSKSASTNELLGVSVTRLDKDIPFSDIKYLAFKSSSSGSGDTQIKVFYMGDSSNEGIPIRHLIQETNEITGGDYSQVSWLYNVKY